MKDLKKRFIILSLTIATLIFSGAVAYAINKNTKQEEVKIVNDPFLNDDIFMQMEVMHKQMNEAFANHHKMMEKMFKDIDNNQKSTKLSGSSLKLTQDENSYIYELKFSSFNKEDVAIKVDNGILNISSVSEKASEGKNNKTYTANNFYYSLSIPKDAKGEPQIKREDGKITITFVKPIAEEGKDKK